MVHRRHRRRIAASLLVVTGLHLLAPLVHAQAETITTTQATTQPGVPRLDLEPWLTRSGELGGHVVQGAGQFGQGVGQQVGGAAGQVYDDVREGRLRWVIGPAKDAIATTRTAPGDRPVEDCIIESVTITES